MFIYETVPLALRFQLYWLKTIIIIHSELRLQIEEEELKSYVLDFEEGIRDEVLMLGSISLEDVQEEEKKLRDEHVKYLDQEAKRKRKIEEDILYREEEAKKRMALFVKEKREFLERREVCFFLILFFLPLFFFISPSTFMNITDLIKYRVINFPFKFQNIYYYCCKLFLNAVSLLYNSKYLILNTFRLESIPTDQL